jgi:hypothetical protein
MVKVSLPVTGLHYGQLLKGSDNDYLLVYILTVLLQLTNMMDTQAQRMQR